ncbi:MAG: hypothetical protein WCW30_02730 [Candidatus Gracilibacteria bacterium]
MQKKCLNCSSVFEIHEKDRAFYEKLDVPNPKICPECRAQRRLAYRNERTLYQRACDLCRKPMISIYSETSPFPVYCQECFWSDHWNAFDFGLEIDVEKPFFPQFHELLIKTPRLAIVNKQSENSDYCNYSFANKNCYLTFGNHYEEDCLYGHYSTKNKNCTDYLWLYKCELCYECLFSKNCYRSVYLDHCEDCQECWFSVDLKGCKNCFLCANLRHKEYYILNKPYSKEEYLKTIASYRLSDYKSFKKGVDSYRGDFRTKFPFQALYQVNCEQCEGSNHEQSKNLRACFDCTKCEDCAYGFQMDETYDSMDMNCMGYDRSEVCYETVGCSGLFNGLACDSCWHDSDLAYCNLCFSSKNCFGCIALQHGEYAILNKKYDKENYEHLMKKIKIEMKKRGEWGEFFPGMVSPFAYNETVASEYYPLSKTEAEKQGFRWFEKNEAEFKGEKILKASKLPDRIEEVKDTILKGAIECEITKKPFRIVKQELQFYRENKLPLPRRHPDQRHKDRMQLRNPRRLWSRTCAKCGASIQTTYAPGRPEIVYCEGCYLKEVY